MTFEATHRPILSLDPTMVPFDSIVQIFYWLRVSLTPRIRARGAEMTDFFGYRLNGPKDVRSQHRHGAAIMSSRHVR